MIRRKKLGGIDLKKKVGGRKVITKLWAILKKVELWSNIIHI